MTSKPFEPNDPSKPVTAVVAVFAVVAIIFVVAMAFAFQHHSTSQGPTTVASVGATLILGFLGGILTALNLQRQILSTEKIAKAQQRLALCLADMQNQFTLQIEDVRRSSDKEKEQEKEQATIRLNYLDPLRVAASDFTSRMRLIDHKLRNDDIGRKERMLRRYDLIKHPKAASLTEFAMWCNGEGYFAMSTIYLAANYFAIASKARQELPLSQLKNGDDARLLKCLDNIRDAFGQEYGIYETLQESVGSYMRTSPNAVMNYRQFCEMMFREEERAWLLRVIDFYCEIDKKGSELTQMANTLTELASFIKTVTQMRVPRVEAPEETETVAQIAAEHRTQPTVVTEWKREVIKDFPSPERNSAQAQVQEAQEQNVGHP